MAPNHERHTISDGKFLFLEIEFFDTFGITERTFSDQHAQAVVELIMALSQLLKFFALAH
jgi:hypothetical protein